MSVPNKKWRLERASSIPKDSLMNKLAQKEAPVLQPIVRGEDLVNVYGACGHFKGMMPRKLAARLYAGQIHKAVEVKS
jgi:hypothetical protein